MVGFGARRVGASGRVRRAALRLAWLAVLATIWACTGGPPTAQPPAAPTARACAESPSPTPSAPAASAVASPADYSVPMVPITGFWTGLRSIGRSDLGLLLAGTPRPSGPRFSRVAVSASDAADLARAFGVSLASSVRLMGTDDVLALVRSDPTALGLVRAEDVQPSVHALAIDGVSLFGSGRISDPAAWPLNIHSTVPSRLGAAALWTLTAGGDVNLDRSVYFESVRRGKGADYPWDGGTARIIGSSCCGFEGSSLVLARQTGNVGAFRALLSGSDVSIVNLEGLASEDYVYRPASLTFTVDPDLLDGLANAGIDAVSLANNHTLDVGAEGIAHTCRKLASLGIAHTGAGSDLASASQPAWLSAGGLRIALLAYDGPQSRNWAGPSTAGAARLDIHAVVSDIEAARAAGANFVIVMPHWGTEYSFYVGRDQRRLAEAMVAAGADLVLGSHSHYVGGMQTIAKPSGDPALVVYSMGNLLFDLIHDQRTLMGVVYELTFDGTRLVQVELNPTVMIRKAQTNLLDPAAGGAATIDHIRAATGRYLSW